LVDIVDKAIRSRMMAAIKGKNTKPELVVRRALHAAGFRFRLHVRKLPGKPDIVLKKYNAAIFVHGCFWHGHTCEQFRWPKSRQEFWRSKITGNQIRDAEVTKMVLAEGWRILLIWECALRGKDLPGATRVANRCGKWLQSNSVYAEIAGKHV
jgi:DNA mismatch endonuclease, patch repair protein